MLLMFIMESIVRPDGVTKEEYLQKNLKLYNHVKECMTKYTTYFLPTMITVEEDKTNVENEELTIIGTIIVGKHVTMTDQEITRALEYYICVIPELRRNDIATALMK